MKKDNKKFKRMFDKLYTDYWFMGYEPTPHGRAMVFGRTRPTFRVSIVPPNRDLTPTLWGTIHNTIFKAQTMQRGSLLIWFDEINTTPLRII